MKDKSGDSSNVAFRLVQAARGKSVNRSKSSDNGTFVSRAMERMMRKYRDDVSAALAKLRSKQNDVAKIKKEEVCAILFCGYGEFYRHRNDPAVTADNARNKLKQLRAEDEKKFLTLEALIPSNVPVGANGGVAGATGEGNAGSNESATVTDGGADEDADDNECESYDDIEDEDNLLCNPVGTEEDEDALAQYLLDEEDEDADDDGDDSDGED